MVHDRQSEITAEPVFIPGKVISRTICTATDDGTIRAPKQCEKLKYAYSLVCAEAPIAEACQLSFSLTTLGGARCRRFTSAVSTTYCRYDTKQNCPSFLPGVANNINGQLSPSTVLSPLGETRDARLASSKSANQDQAYDTLQNNRNVSREK